MKSHKPRSVPTGQMERRSRTEKCLMCDDGRWPYEPWLMLCPYCKGTQRVPVTHEKECSSGAMDADGSFDLTASL